MSLFKGNLDSSNLFTANDDIRGLRLISTGGGPSFLSLESDDGVDHFMWFDDSDNFRHHTAVPTDANKDSAGSVMYGASNAGASIDLSNITTGAIPCALTSDTTNTDDLGTSSVYWKDLYLSGVLYLAADATIASGSSARIDFVGDLVVGVDGTGNDLTLYADTSGDKIVWSAAGCTNVGTLTFTDDTQLVFGDSSDFTIDFNQTALVMDNKTASTGNVVIGSVVDTDVEFHGGTNTSDAGWDADADTFQICDDAILNIGGSALNTMDGVKIFYNATDTNLDIDAVNANDGIKFGSNTATDLEFHGAAYDFTWTAATDDLNFLDGVTISMGTATDLIWSFADPVVTATAGGTDSEFNLVNYAAQTTALLRLEGATNTWNGADDVGMLWLEQDAAMAHAGATMLLVETSATAINAAQGFMARFVGSGTAKASSWGVSIEVAATQGALWTNGIVTHIGQDSPGAYIFQLTANDDTGNTGALDIHASGTDPALRVTGDEDDTPMASFICAANTDVSAVLIDGDTAGWLGATGTGMLHLQNDIAAGHANATMLLIDKNANAIAEINDGRGTCLRIVENMDVSGSPPSYAMYISCIDNEALYVDSGNVVVDEYVTAGVGAPTTGGLVTCASSTDLHTSTPTNAELDTALGALALAQNGFIGLAYDSTDGLPYIIVSDGTDWFYVPKLVKAT